MLRHGAESCVSCVDLGEDGLARYSESEATVDVALACPEPGDRVTSIASLDQEPPHHFSQDAAARMRR